MKLLKLCSLFLALITSEVTLASSHCETFTGHNFQEKLCFEKKLKAWLPEKCLKTKTCKALTLLTQPGKKIKIPSPVDGQNPASLFCHELKLEVLILRDADKNEQSFCRLKDNSVVDSNAVERVYQ